VREQSVMAVLGAAALLMLPNCCAATLAPEVSQQEVVRLLESRFMADRTGACVLAAVVEHDNTVRGRYCRRAKPSQAAPPSYSTPMEIGSISKTMLGLAVALLVERDRWSLDDPIVKHLPLQQAKTASIQKITVRQLLTHMSGLPALPADLRIDDPANPYAHWTAQDILRAFERAELTAAPGEKSEYSNFGMLVLSVAVDRAYAGGIVRALETELFQPLKMARSSVASNKSARAPVVGHDAEGVVVPPWTAEPEFAGVGFVLSTLDDMAAYANALLGAEPPELSAALRLSLTPIYRTYAMAWRLANIAGADIALHEGATAGFSSFIALDLHKRRGVIVLADTGLGDLGGLADVGLALLGLEVKVRPPRVTMPPSPELRKALVGDYSLAGSSFKVWESESRLMAQGKLGDPFELLFDSWGDFYPKGFTAILTPSFVDGRIDAFSWRQGGGVTGGLRVPTTPIAKSSQMVEVQSLLGSYSLLANFDLRVFQEDGVLKVQGTGQPAVTVEVVGKDRVVSAAVGFTIDFVRGQSGDVTSLILRQGATTLRGERTQSR
jgi:CubicO group peptidase (beta-lactamase class C family)